LITVTFRVLILFIVDLAGMAGLELLIEIPFFKYILWEQSLLAISLDAIHFRSRPALSRASSAPIKHHSNNGFETRTL
ncbi:hypothetical protein QCD79_31085, partial [Pseudomonas quasicaspiana]|nr:hypothetical protein [Pseudomonas quasicaspiana]